MQEKETQLLLWARSHSKSVQSAALLVHALGSLQCAHAHFAHFGLIRPHHACFSHT